MRITSTLVVFLTFLSGCASHQTGVPLDRDTPVPRPISVVPGTVDSVAYLGVGINVAGSRIGAHHGGLLKVEQYSIIPDARTEERWAEMLKAAGEKLLRNAGYPVKETSSLFGQLQDYGDVRYALAGEVKRITVNTYGNLAGDKTDASLRVKWELFDTETRNVKYSATTSGSGSVGGTSGNALVEAFSEAFGKTLSREEFVAKLGN